MGKTGLADLVKTGYKQVDPYMISVFAERWHDDVILNIIS
jgi:hypothetical protein